jgi:hypothetical protein
LAFVSLKTIMSNVISTAFGQSASAYDKYHPYLFHFKNVDWAIFGTLTWEDETRRKEHGRAEWFRQRDFWQLVVAASRQFRIRGKDLACYRAMEFGEGECHYHFLIARNGIEQIPENRLAEAMRDLWQLKLQPFDSDKPGIGRADIRPYDQAKELAGVRYCLKKEFNQYGDEQERFDWLSGGLMRLLKRQSAQIEPRPLSPRFEMNPAGVL